MDVHGHIKFFTRKKIETVILTRRYGTERESVTARRASLLVRQRARRGERNTADSILGVGGQVPAQERSHKRQLTFLTVMPWLQRRFDIATTSGVVVRERVGTTFAKYFCTETAFQVNMCRTSGNADTRAFP